MNGFISILYIQYHCLPRTRSIKEPDSTCHSYSLSKRFEFIKIFKHQVIGSIAIIKSPHFP